MIINWIFTIIALVGTFLNAQMNILGFVFWIVSNTGFLIINFLNTNYAEAVLFFVNTLVSISGIITWRKKQKKKETKF
jgi:nicotinamide riboside transporter PnuC